MRYFGDSYDLVKLLLISWLRHFGDWSVHPMLTEKASFEDILAFERFLGAPMISTEVLSLDTNRDEYLSCACSTGNLFLDPDTGLRINSTNGRRAPEYLFSAELSRIVASRPQALTLVFDQSLQRGRESTAMLGKLRTLMSDGIYSFAYISHACFILAGHDKELIENARFHVQSESKLPTSRFLVPTET